MPKDTMLVSNAENSFFFKEEEHSGKFKDQGRRLRFNLANISKGK
jgi:hypothetical protein